MTRIRLRMSCGPIISKSMEKTGFKGDWSRLLLFIAYVSAFILVAVFISGCRVKYISVPEYHEIHDTLISKEYIDREVIKEVTVKDSSSFRKEDSIIYIERWHWERDYRYEKALQAKIDSLTQLKRDSVPYPVPYEVRVPAELKWWQKSLIWWGVICFAILAICIFVKIKIPK